MAKEQVKNDSCVQDDVAVEHRVENFNHEIPSRQEKLEKLQDTLVISQDVPPEGWQEISR